MIHEVIMALGGFPGPLFTETGGKIMEFATFISPGEKVLLNRILQIVQHYTNLQKFIYDNISVGSVEASCAEGKSETCVPGRYIQAFCHALNQILGSYRREVGELEKEALNDPYLPLTLILSRAEKYLELFQILNSMIVKIKEENVQGCCILGFVHRHHLSGIGEVKTAMKIILHRCHFVLFKQLSSWLLCGTLIDEHNEFFIQYQINNTLGLTAVQQDVGINSHGVSQSNNLFPEYSNYIIVNNMLPPYMTTSSAYKILFIGKTILMFSKDPRKEKDFVSHKHVSSIWGKQEKEFYLKLKELQEMETFNVTLFEKTIEDIRLCVTEHLWQLVVVELELFHQLKLIKDFFLLGRGELFAEFMYQAKHILDKIPTKSSNRDVNRAFQVAAQKVLMTDEAALDKFYFSLPRKTKSEFDNEVTGSGWHFLSLKYKVEWPLHLIFSEDVLNNYNLLFSFFLRVKKTQFDLHNVWSYHMTKKKQGQGASSALWQLRNNLMFVIDNLQYYLQVDVLESQYTILQTAINSTKDFEQIQRAHTIFQANILSQTFLLMNPNGDIPSDDNKGIKMNPVHRNLESMLNLCKEFCNQNWEEVVDEICVATMQTQFQDLIELLLQLLSSLRSQPCGSHLAQLLLRLDYNCWFSSYSALSTSVSQS